MKRFMFRLPVVGSTACGLFLSVCLVQAAYAEIIDLNARSAAFDSPVEVFLDAGTYSVTPVGIVGGGTYDSWTPWAVVTCGNPLGCTPTVPTTVTGYLTAYVVLSDALESVTVDGVALNPTAAFPTPTIVSAFVSGAPAPWGGTWYTVQPAIVYPDPVSALASATTSTFTLAHPAIVGFATGDLLSVSYDNSGGISLLVVPVVPVVPVVNNELRNISTRADIGNGQAVAVAGFIISGDTEMCVVVRGRGQSVNVNQTLLENPTLTLKSGSTTIEFNDDWQEHPTWATVQALGKAPTEPSESAFHICLDPGAYTAFLRGTIGTTRGIGIIEVIDVDERSSYLFNISTRAQVKTGARRVVAGFIIDGDQPRQVLIRGRGPSVNLNNVTLLADPFIQLRQGPTVVAENDNWEDASNSAEIAATGKAPDNPIESAILISLQPGPYTVFLQGANGEIGLGIIEVLDLTGGQ